MFGLTLHLLGIILPLAECLDPTLPPLLQTGSIYVTPYLVESNCVIKNYGPKHSLYAMTSDTFFNIVPNRDNIHSTTPTWLHQADLDEMPVYVEPHENKPIVKPEVAIALAKRMIGVTFRYRYMRCNCRHYVDYLKYGRTFGRWWDFSYMMISEDCPLHGPLDSSSKVNTLEFKLYDKHKTPVELAPPSRSLSPPTAAPPLPRRKPVSSVHSYALDSDSDSSCSPTRRDGSPTHRSRSSSRRLWASTSSPAHPVTPLSPTRRKSPPTQRKETSSSALSASPNHLKPTLFVQLSDRSHSSTGKSKKGSSFKG